MKKTFPLLALLLVILTACPKKKDQIADNPTTPQLVADSAYLYTKEVYLWNTLPGIGTYESFNPRKFVNTDLVKTADDVIKSIRSLHAADHFSYATSVEESDQTQTGEGVDWGFFVKSGLIATPETAANVRWFVTYVYNASDAAAKGVKRGWIVNKIDGIQLRGDQASVDKLNAIFFGAVTSASVEFVKPDATTQTIVVNKTKFTANTILYSNVFTNGTKKTGYFVFNTFLGTTAASNELITVINNFIGQGINELIIDLRNNLGGSTAMQDFLANILVPASKNGQTMYRYEFNQQLQQDNFPLLKKKFGWGNGSFTAANNTEKFVKNGSLALSRIFFIVTDNTASSSELLINNLKPVMDVKLIGESNTYGKPVGFFPIELFDKVALYPVSFRTVNSVGAEVAYAGFAPDKEATDGINKDWGDITEPSLANTLSYINTGSFMAAAPTAILKTTPRSVIANKTKQLDEKKKEKVGMFLTGKEEDLSGMKLK